MGQKIVVGPFNRGLKNDRAAFAIDADSFPALINAYQWRGRVKRKRGTSPLSRLKRYFDSTNPSYSSISTITLDGAGAGNLLTGFSLQEDGNIVPGSVEITVGGNTYTDPAMDGNLSPSGTINYATGDIIILAEAGNAASAIFIYYPTLPVMGLEDLVLSSNQFPGTLGFDTVYSYNVSTFDPYPSYDVSFYKNPPSAGTYVQKTNWTPTTWNGDNYQQFWSANYQNACWVTNGIEIPFSPTNVGMQFAPSNTITYVTNTATTITFTITGSPLVIGDFVLFNEFTTAVPANASTLNFQSGYVTGIAGSNYTFTLPNATLVITTYTAGIIQYLTNRSDTTVDCLRWFDGDPVNGANPPVFSAGTGWVNFAPPLSQGSYSISDLPARQYYLVGARIVIPFKDRLLFLGPVVQASTGNSIYLRDTIIYSQNGVPYYTASYTGSVFAPTSYQSILVPSNQTGVASAFWEDVTGFGGFIQAGVDQAINTVSLNEDVLVIGFDFQQVRLVYTGNDIVPFNLFTINSEYGSSSTFSAINLDKGVITRGSRGFTITSQVECRRIDLEIPDAVFEFNLVENGPERVCAQRDFVNEWIYFTYASNQNASSVYVFPTKTLQYNYRDDSWAVFNESYTTYGTFRKTTGFTWATVGNIYPTWSQWNDPWNAGTSTLLQPEVIAGNQQGFIVVRADGTGEANSLQIQSFSGSTVTCPNHCLVEGDFIVISGAIGTIASEVNGKVFSVAPQVTIDTFVLNPNIGSGTYFGGGLIKKMYVPFIQSMQFPVSWEMGRKTRLGPQQYLFSTTANSQITLLIYLSQNADDPYNDGPLYPNVNSPNNSLIYSTVLYTCPESTNLGLTPANINLNMVTAIQQQQIWHRMNTSLLGDTVQVAFTLSEEQMRDETLTYQFAEIELFGMILDVSPSMLLA